MSICLTKQEVKNVTEMTQFAAQERVLAQLQIPYKVRPNGSMLVMRSAMGEESAKVSEPEPDFSSPS